MENINGLGKGDLVYSKLTRVARIHRGKVNGIRYEYSDPIRAKITSIKRDKSGTIVGFGIKIGLHGFGVISKLDDWSASVDGARTQAERAIVDLLRLDSGVFHIVATSPAPAL